MPTERIKAGQLEVGMVVRLGAVGYRVTRVVKRPGWIHIRYCPGDGRKSKPVRLSSGITVEIVSTFTQQG